MPPGLYTVGGGAAGSDATVAGRTYRRVIPAAYCRGEGDWHQNAGSFCDSGGLRVRRNRVKIGEQSGPPYPKIEM